MAKIYTKTGDDGSTGLVGGSRVSKDDVRVEAYGTVDELNAQMGVVAAGLAQLMAIDADSGLFLSRQVRQIQQQLFVVQSLLAAESPEMQATLPQLPEGAVAQLEQWVDAMTSQLPPMRAFVIPGGTLLAAQCHVARTVCRRAERRVVSLSATAVVPAVLRQYLNRLSDYLFTLSRRAVQLEDKAEVFWQPSK